MATVFLRRFRTQAHLKTNVPLIERSFPPCCLNTGVDSGENCRCCRLQWLFLNITGMVPLLSTHAGSVDTPAIIRDYLSTASPRNPPTQTHTHTPFLVFPPSKLKQLKVMTGPVLSCSAAYKHAQASRK